MKKSRYILWGSFVGALVVVVAVMVRMVDQPPASMPEAGPAVASEDAAILEPRENDWIKGNPDASVVVVKYSDFQCPACRFYAAMDDQVSEELGDDVLFIYRHFPLRNFRYSRLAATFTEAAGRQGKFWEMHDLIFINQQRWSNDEDGEAIFRRFAENLELDMEQFDRDLADPSLIERIDSDYEDGVQLGVRAVPTIFVNGRQLQGVDSMEEYKRRITANF
jgi:protein-disulfide isomerase